MSEKYIQVENSEKYIKLLTSLWISYIREIYEGDIEIQNKTDNEIAGWLIGRINIQGQRDTMHLELIYSDEILVGFAMYAIDLGGIKGIVEAGLGYIMELYILPEYRRKGIASKVFSHMENVLQNQGALQIYLTPDSGSGIPFWKNAGFRDSGKTDPDNKMPIYIKEIHINNQLSENL